MKTSLPLFVAIGFSFVACVKQAQVATHLDSDIENTFDTEPHAKDHFVTEKGKLFLDEVGLTLETVDGPYGISLSWPNNIQPPNSLVLQSGMTYEVTYITDYRMHPIPFCYKYGFNAPKIASIKSKNGDLIYNASICPVHQIKAERNRLVIVDFDKMPSNRMANRFPYGNKTWPIMKATWGKDFRETVNEYVCHECLAGRQKAKSKPAYRLNRG